MLNLIITIAAIVAVLILGSYALWRWNTQPNIIEINSNLPSGFPSLEFSHQNFENLMLKYVSAEGRVDYQRWFDDTAAQQQLTEYLAAVAKYSPENTPQRFQQKNDPLIYWVYAYNAVVIKSILINWPLSSVTDLTAPVEVIKGLGFFYKQKFIYGGQPYSLYQVENVKIFGGESDPRVHFILNCGSESCPVLRPQLPIGDALDPFLDNAATEFIANPNNLTVSHSEKIIYLSTIFKWNKDDFIRASADKSLFSYLISIADQYVIKELNHASTYRIEFVEYDWSLNKAQPKIDGEH